MLAFNDNNINSRISRTPHPFEGRRIRGVHPSVRSDNFENHLAERKKGLMVLSGDAVLIAANRQALDIFHYDHDELIGRDHTILVSRETTNTTSYRELWEGLRRGDICSSVSRYKDRFGHDLWLHATYEPMIHGLRRSTQIIMTLVDVDQ